MGRDPGDGELCPPRSRRVRGVGCSSSPEQGVGGGRAPGQRQQVDTAETSPFSPQRSAQFFILFPLTSPPRVSTTSNASFWGGTRAVNAGAGAWAMRWGPGTRESVGVCQKSLTTTLLLSRGLRCDGSDVATSSSARERPGGPRIRCPSLGQWILSAV